MFDAAEAIERELGPIDYWVNNAMVTVFSPVSRLPPAELHRVTSVTYFGTVHGTMAALRQMQPRNRGTIVQIGSALGYRGIPLQSAYCGAKHAVRGFTDSLRTELLHENSRIRLTMIHLPAVNTPQFDWARTHMAHQPRPMAPVYQPEAIAEHVVNTAPWPRREYWIGGSTIATILGNILAPGIFDRFLARTAWKGQAREAQVSHLRQDNLLTPVSSPHRIRGSFGREAKPQAIAVSGDLVRIGATALACAVAFGIAQLLVGARPRKRRWPAPLREAVRHGRRVRY